MSDTGLLLVCVSALATVFVLLSALALCIRALTTIFPGREPAGDDAAVAAAVASAAALAYPGLRVTRVVEEP